MVVFCCCSWDIVSFSVLGVYLQFVFVFVSNTWYLVLVSVTDTGTMHQSTARPGLDLISEACHQAVPSGLSSRSFLEAFVLCLCTTDLHRIPGKAASILLFFELAQ